MVANLPRGATRRLYTTPHSLLDTSPAQLPRQLLDTGASTNVLLERARVSPVSSAASSHSSESVKAAEHRHTAAPTPHLSSRNSSTGTAVAAASSWRPVSTLHALDRDLVSSQADSRTQFPAFVAPSMPASHTARPSTAEPQWSFPPVASSPSQEFLLPQRAFQRSSPETASAQQMNPVPDFPPQLASSPAQSGVPASDKNTNSANSSRSIPVPGGWPQNSPQTATDGSSVQAEAQQSHSWHAADEASDPAQVNSVVTACFCLCECRP